MSSPVHNDRTKDATVQSNMVPRESPGIKSFMSEVDIIVQLSNKISDAATSIQLRETNYEMIIRKFERKEVLTPDELEQVRDLNALCN